MAGAEAPEQAAIGKLGAARRAWEAVLAAVRAGEAPREERWKDYGPRYGWQLKVTEGRTALVYLIPREGGFTAALALPDAALAALATSGLPAALVRAVRQGPRKPEGWPARVLVTERGGAEEAIALVGLKRAAAAPRPARRARAERAAPGARARRRAGPAARAVTGRGRRGRRAGSP
jgi:hypothetical protein